MDVFSQTEPPGRSMCKWLVSWPKCKCILTRNDTLQLQREAYDHTFAISKTDANLQNVVQTRRKELSRTTKALVPKKACHKYIFIYNIILLITGNNMRR